MKRILIITYYWPPSGGAGVQRWLKFVKYLPQFGWKPIVVVPENPEYPVIDYSLQVDIPPEAEIIKLPIWEPYGVFKKITGREKEEKVNAGLLFDERKQSLTEKISLWIRGNLLIPDPRIFWVNPAVRRLKKIISEIQPDVIATTGPPHSVHLIGYKLKKIYELPWVADLRDPWSNIDFLEKFYPSKYALKRHKRIEKKVLAETDRIVTVSPTWSKELERVVNMKIDCIPNGFDLDDLIRHSVNNSELFVISHVGMINSYRNNNYFWKALNDLCEESEDFNKRLQIRFFGIHDKTLASQLAQYPNLAGKYKISDYIPHNEVKNKYVESDCLLIFQNQSKNACGHIPGKLFEAMASKKPVIALANPISDLAKIIVNCNAGYVCDFNDVKNIKKSISAIFHKQYGKYDDLKIQHYSRKNLTMKLSNLLNEITFTFK